LEDKRHVFLVPGIFGFTSGGGLSCLAHARRVLEPALAELAIDAEVHEVVTTQATSITRRAVELLEAILRSPAAESGEIHLIGHSAGGLDARMLATPNVSLRTELNPKEIAPRIRTVVTIATPHHGTPLAGYLASPYGRQLAQLLTLMTVRALDSGRPPIEPLLDLGEALVGLDHGVEIEDSAVDQIRAGLLDGLEEDRAKAAQEMADRVGSDHALYDQLTPAGIDLFNAATVDRDSVRYGSVIAVAPPPALKPVSPGGLDPSAQASHGAFAALNRVVGRATTAEYRGQLSGDQVELLQHTFGSTLSTKDNDGVVPSLSQLWGKAIHAARGDHYDVLGHFDDPTAEPPHREWLASRSGFDREAFKKLWTEVARFIADNEGEAA
jgi:pimeloyl-ACP methyl ester carboxylesterase